MPKLQYQQKEGRNLRRYIINHSHLSFPILATHFISINSLCYTAFSNRSAETTQQNFISRLYHQTSTEILLGPIPLYVTTSSHLWFRCIEHCMNFHWCLHSCELLIFFPIPSKLNSDHWYWWFSIILLQSLYFYQNMDLCFIPVVSYYTLGLGFFDPRAIKSEQWSNDGWCYHNYKHNHKIELECVFLTKIMTIPHCVDIFKSLT